MWSRARDRRSSDVVSAVSNTECSPTTDLTAIHSVRHRSGSSDRLVTLRLKRPSTVGFTFDSNSLIHPLLQVSHTARIFLVLTDPGRSEWRSSRRGCLPSPEWNSLIWELGTAGGRWGPSHLGQKCSFDMLPRLPQKMHVFRRFISLDVVCAN